MDNRIGFPHPYDINHLVWLDQGILTQTPDFIRLLHFQRKSIRDMEKSLAKDANPFGSEGCFPIRNRDKFPENLNAAKSLESLVHAFESGFVRSRDLLRHRLLFKQNYSSSHDPSRFVTAFDVVQWNAEPQLCKAEEKPKAQFEQQVTEGLKIVEKAKADLEKSPDRGPIVATVNLGSGQLLLEISTTRASDGKRSESPQLQNVTWITGGTVKNSFKSGETLDKDDAKRIFTFIEATHFEFEFAEDKCGYQSSLGEVRLSVSPAVSSICDLSTDSNCSRDYYSLKHGRCDRLQSLEVEKKLSKI